MKILYTSTVSIGMLLGSTIRAVTANSERDNARIRGSTSSRASTRQRRVQTNETTEEGDGGGMYFNRVATWFVCSELDATCDVDNVTSAENLIATDDGMKVLYTNSLLGAVGAVDISDIFNPVAAGSIDVGGMPTSIATCPGSNQAIVVVDTSNGNKVNATGIFHVIAMDTMTVLYTGDLGGQPDCVRMSQDCTRAVIAIENERNEDLANVDLVTMVNETTGEEYDLAVTNSTPGLPQFPGGYITILDTTADDPAAWTLTNVNISGLDNGIVWDMDPEPEFVSINENNIVVVTLQENNGIVLINANDYTVLDSYSAGTVTLVGADTIVDGKIIPKNTITNPREPDGVVWLDADHYATADEGDWIGGTRGFTIWNQAGDVVYNSGIEMDKEAQRVGHYPEHRSDGKGNEPENVDFAIYGADELLFVNSERSSLVFVYDVKDKTKPVLRQLLPAGLRPAGALAIPSRNLFLVSSEDDERALNVRGSISIYYKNYDRAVYPYITSSDRSNKPGVPIPFGGLSSLTTGKCRTQQRGTFSRDCDEGKFLYTSNDDVYKRNMIYKIDPTQTPPVIVQSMFLSDWDGVLRESLMNQFGMDKVSIDAILNGNHSVNLDIEGLDTSVHGGFWVTHEGTGNATAIVTPDLLMYANKNGVIKDVIPLPADLNKLQVLGNGMSGVAEDYLSNTVVVTFAGPLMGEENPRIGIWNRDTKEWTFAFYPTDPAESQFEEGSMVVVSDIAFLGTEGQFLILESDNRAGPDAAVKHINVIDLNGTAPDSTLEKIVGLDILPDNLRVATYGPVVEKVSGLTIDRDRVVWVLNDNDGAEDNNGETLLIKVGILPP